MSNQPHIARAMRDASPGSVAGQGPTPATEGPKMIVVNLTVAEAKTVVDALFYAADEYLSWIGRGVDLKSLRSCANDVRTWVDVARTIMAQSDRMEADPT